MILTQWQIELEDGTHTVEMQRSGWNARHTVRLDDREIFVGNVPIEFGRHIPFDIAGHSGLLEINVPGRLAYEYELRLDGQAVPIYSGPQRTQLPRG